MRMAEAPPSDLVVGGGVGSSPPRTPEVGNPSRFPGHVEVLCRDVPIGRITSNPHPRLPTFAATYLSLDVELAWRDTSGLLANKVIAEGHPFAMRGVFGVLATEVCERPVRRRRSPARYVKNFALFGHSTGPWPLARFQVASGVDLADLVRLGELARVYHSNMINLDVDEIALVRFIPRECEEELRQVAAKIARNADSTCGDTG